MGGSMNWNVMQGDVFDLLPTIAPGSVDCCVTSPPYWALRSYLPKGHPLKPLELGSEKTPAGFVANLVRVFRLVRDCLADHGTVWLNIGDTYTHAPGKRKMSDVVGLKQETNHGSNTTGSAFAEGIDAGNLCLIPWHLVIALQADGWIVRSVVAWTKPAPMPSSVTGWQWQQCKVKETSGKKSAQQRNGTAYDGVTGGPQGSQKCVPGVKGTPFDSRAEWSDCPGCKKCEKTDGLVLRRGSWRPTSSWEPILMLAKSDRYFCDGEAVKTPSAAATVSRNNYTRIIDDPDEQFAVRHDHETVKAGANIRDVWKQKLTEMSKEDLVKMIEGMADGSMCDEWRMASEALGEKHYAAFPTELVRRALMAGVSERGYCPACRSPWVRVIEVEKPETRTVATNGPVADHGFLGGERRDDPIISTTIGWRPSCSCPAAEPQPGLVLDPFTGSGRTALTARRLGLNFVGCELNPEYAAMARRIITEDSPLFNAEQS